MSAGETQAPSSLSTDAFFLDWSRVQDLRMKRVVLFCVSDEAVPHSECLSITLAAYVSIAPMQIQTLRQHLDC